MTLKDNFIYNSILTVSKYLFPLIVYPYVSRTLGLSNIGIVNFIDNIVNYFVLVSMMGIMTVGVREIAAKKNNSQALSKTFVSLLALTTIGTVLAIATLWIAMYTVPKLIPYQSLLYIGIIKLVFNLFLIEWFYMGMEQFKYITTRSIIVKCIYVASVFIFVREASDYTTYYFLSTLMIVANAVINIIYSRKYIKYSLKSISLRPYAKAFIIVGIYILFTNVYTYLNPVWLGFVTDTDQVGFFTTATKLHNIIMAVLLAFSNILFPRVSNLLAEGNKAEFWKKIDTSFDAIFLFAFPTLVFIITAGPELLHIIVGDGFEGSYIPLRIITPLVLVIGLEQILVIQILMATHQDSTVLRNAFFGALVAFVLNLLITSSLGAIGSAIVWLVAELVILCLSIEAIYRQHRYLMPIGRLSRYMASYAPLLLMCILVCHYMESSLVMVIAIGTLVVIYAAIVEWFVMKNKVLKLILK